MGFKSPVEIPDMKMNKPLPESNSGAGDRSGEGRLGERRGSDSGSNLGEA